MSTEFRIEAPMSEFIDTDEAAAELLGLAMRKVDVDPGDLIGFDTETHGKKVPINKKPLDWMNDTVTYWSLSFKVDDVYRRWCIAQQYFLYFAPLLENPKAWFACWNAKYDAHISWNCNINIWNAHIVDGLALTGLHDENKRIKGLKACAADYCGYQMTPYKSLFDEVLDSSGKKAKEYETSLVELVELGHEARVANYASYDAFAHLVTVEWLIEKLKNTPIGMDGYSLWQLFLDMEIYYTETLWRMERRGMMVDIEYLKSKVPVLQSQIDVLEKEINRIAGYPLNVGSPKQLGEFFFTEKGLNLPPVKMTASQQYSTDVEVMNALDEAGVHVAKMILEVRTLKKFKGTYIDPLVTMSEYYEDGRIHPTNNQVGTVTGRLSGENPNPHNLPRPDTDEWGVRSAFIAPEGKKLLVGDYCIDENMRVITEDLRWIRAGDVQVGDKLIGFDEDISKSRYRSSTVTKVRTINKPRYKITMSNGAILTMSNDHSWVVGGGGHTWKRRRRRWVRTDQLEIGDQIAYFTDPWEEKERNYKLGYLAGVLDGEGWVAKTTKVGFSQSPNPCLDYAEECLADLPLTWKRRSRKKDDVQAIEFYGNKGGLCALGMIRPKRLLPKAKNLWEGRRTWSSKTPRVFVKSIKKLRSGKVVAIQTSTHTFITEGFLSHNCQIEMRIMADLAQDERMLQAIRDGKDLHSFTVSVMNPGVSYEEVVEAKKTDEPTDRQKWLKRERQAKKSIGFGIIYGAGPPKISTGIEISEADWQSKINEMDDNTFSRRVTRLMKKNPLFTEERAVEQVGRHAVAAEKIKEYFETFPAVKGFMDETPTICRHRMAYDENNNPREWEFLEREPGAQLTSECGHFRPFGYVQTLSGRYRRLEDIDHKNYFYRSEAERQAVNTRIQGSAADICKAAMLRIDHCPILNALGVEILNQVHDEIVMECPEENVEEAMPIVKQYMEHPFGDEPDQEALSIPIPVDLKYVDNWAMAK